MTDEKEKVGLLRHKIISPVLMEGWRNQMKYFKELEVREFFIPGMGPKRFKASTMKGWLNRYRKNGFKAIVPKIREDKGGYRKLTLSDRERIKLYREEHPELPMTLFYSLCLRENIFSEKQICYATFNHFLKKEGLSRRRSSKGRRKYEMDRFGELWVGDFMHGPQVLDGKRKRKAILLLIIDDYSRYVVGAKFSFLENTGSLEEVFKEAILSFGVVERLYVDNGSAFSSKYLEKVCAHLGIGLIHSKPYDSPSRGKVERLFRTIRGRFLTLHKNKEMTLDELNEAFSKWLREDYHFKKHSTIQVTPFNRYVSSIEKYPLKRVSPEEIKEYFFETQERTVRLDATIQYEGIYYEVPTHYIGSRIQVRHEQGDKSQIYLYENNKRVCELKPVDSRMNAKLYRPTPRENTLTFHKEEKP